jgi:translocation and assembly module TamA
MQGPDYRCTTLAFVIWLMIHETAVVRGAAPVDRLNYETKIEGVSSGRLRRELERQAQTYQNRKRPPASSRQLAHRAQSDIPRMKAVLHAQGYYEGQASVTVDHEKTPALVLFTIDPGPQYRIGRWDILYRDAENINALPALSAEGTHGRPAEATAILAKEEDFLRQLRNKGYPFCRMNNRDVTIGASDQTVTITSWIIPGSQAHFGPVNIAGLDDVKEGYVRRRIRWQAHDVYQPRQIEELEKELLQCGLFVTARVKTETSLDANDLLPIHIQLNERKHRTVRIGATHVSDDRGLGGQISWEHRNMFGDGRRLHTELAASEVDWRQTTTYMQPDFTRPHLDLLLDLEVSRKYPEAYDSQSVHTGATLQYTVVPWHTRFWTGIAQEISTVEQFNTRNRYRFLELPLGLDWDRRDDPLDAKRGWRFMVQTIPHVDAGSSLSFFKHTAETSYYQPLLPAWNTLVAGRVGVGHISGAALASVPADKRFYAGGAGSVRGYEFQSIGPQIDGTPTGGLSRLETSLELRSTWGPKVGTVVFLDGGTILVESFRRGNEQLMRWGAGVGLRYSLGFAPLRLDVAVPLDRQEHDREFQFYVSIGQAF